MKKLGSLLIVLALSSLFVGCPKQAPAPAGGAPAPAASSESAPASDESAQPAEQSQEAPAEQGTGGESQQ
ncbi:MAG: hypothetical protein WBH86_17045 [Thermogutta sp.]|nr:hypothetical protein [Thermogutta sp.]HOP76371.1 hypothetical protein [Thermogutta sp.]HPU05323.1 hypothetical protein [Thermogutta sp.]HPZ83168.1 hypothetical protein [Thermogutta sp.]HQF12790.1 hypothetical protein [Thermogutta sp.]